MEIVLPFCCGAVAAAKVPKCDKTWWHTVLIFVISATCGLALSRDYQYIPLVLPCLLPIVSWRVRAALILCMMLATVLTKFLYLYLPRGDAVHSMEIYSIRALCVSVISLYPVASFSAASERGCMLVAFGVLTRPYAKHAAILGLFSLMSYEFTAIPPLCGIILIVYGSQIESRLRAFTRSNRHG